MTTVRRSLLLSLAERYFGILIQLISFFVLARLLTPAQIGLYSVAAATIGLAQVVRDFGIGSYLIQETDITPERVRTAFTLTGLISLASFLILVGCAPWLAGFYDHPQLGLILQVLAINFLLIPFSSTALALLRRSMNFKALFWIATVANLISTVGAIACAAATNCLSSPNCPVCNSRKAQGDSDSITDRNHGSILAARKGGMLRCANSPDSARQSSGASRSGRVGPVENIIPSADVISRSSRASSSGPASTRRVLATARSGASAAMTGANRASARCKVPISVTLLPSFSAC